MVLGAALTLRSALSAVRSGCHNFSLCVEAKERRIVCVYACARLDCAYKGGSRLVYSSSRRADSVSTKSRFIGVRIK